MKNWGRKIKEWWKGLISDTSPEVVYRITEYNHGRCDVHKDIYRRGLFGRRRVDTELLNGDTLTYERALEFIEHDKKWDFGQKIKRVVVIGGEDA